MPKKSGTTTTKSSKQKVVKKSIPNKQGTTTTFTSDDLVSQGNIALSSMQFELAVKFFKRALQMTPTDTSIMDSLAEVLMQLGETNEAEQLFKQSISLEPSRNPYKWCYLAQLQNGQEALFSYKKAVEIMSSHITSDDDEVNTHIKIYTCR